MLFSSALGSCSLAAHCGLHLGPKDQGAGIHPAKHCKESFFGPGIDAIHPQLSLHTQKPYTVAVWQSCSKMQRTLKELVTPTITPKDRLRCKACSVAVLSMLRLDEAFRSFPSSPSKSVPMPRGCYSAFSD